MKKKTHTQKAHTKKPRLFSLAALCFALPIACMAAFSGMSFKRLNSGRLKRHVQPVTEFSHKRLLSDGLGFKLLKEIKEG